MNQQELLVRIDERCTNLSEQLEQCREDHKAMSVHMHSLENRFIKLEDHYSSSSAIIAKVFDWVSKLSMIVVSAWLIYHMGIK
jgi:hypothetical protein